MSFSHRNYKLIYDPELDLGSIKKYSHVTYQYQQQVDTKREDPRLNVTTKSRLYNTSFQIVNYSVNSASIHPDAVKNDENTVLVSHISPLSTESQIMTVLSVYGQVTHIDIIKDPTTHAPLGLAQVTFNNATSAQIAVKNGNGRRTMIADAIKIEFDFSGEKLSAALLSPSEKISERIYSMSERKKPSRWGTRPDTIPKSQSYDYTLARKLNREKTDPVKAVISREALPFMRGAMEELERIFNQFKFIDIYHDACNWFISFDTLTVATEAQKYVQDRSIRVLGYPIELSIPSSHSTTTTTTTTTITTQQQPSISPPQQQRPAMTAKQILFEELADIFLKDVKNRIIRPCIYDFLVPSSSSTSNIPKPSASSIIASVIAPLKEEAPAKLLESDIVNTADHSSSIYKLPRFKRKVLATTPPAQKLHLEDDEMEDVHITTDDDEEKKPTSPPPTPQQHKNPIKKKKKYFSYTSSDDDEDFLASIPPLHPKEKLVVIENTEPNKKRKLLKRSSRKAVAVPPILNKVIVEQKEQENMSSLMDIDIDGIDSQQEEEEDEPEVNHRKDERVVKQEDDFDQKTLEKLLYQTDDDEISEDDNEPLVELTKEFDPFCQTKDVEDLEYLKIAITEKVDPQLQSANNNALETLNRNEQRMSQSARTRGYYKIPDAVKATYLSKNKPLFEPGAIQPKSFSSSALTTTTRIMQRRLGLRSQTKTCFESDLLKYAALKTHKKKLQFRKSPIHDWGVYAQQHIEANDMVIEYTGEIIRHQVAEQRERLYGTNGFLFRMDEDVVMDATKKGSLARFINHACTPNCTAKILTINQQKKIMIYANRDIEPGEEITYDYKLEQLQEGNKVPCLCGSKFCKGTLN